MRIRSIGKYSLLAVGLFGSGACAREAPPKPVAPSKVENAVPEAQLTAVTLTPAALASLRLQIVTAESSVVSSVRTIGGEVTVPPGSGVKITAPVAAVVLAPEGGEIPRAGSIVTTRQALMRIIPLPPDRNLMRTSQELTVAEAKLREAEAEATRVAALYADRLVSARDYERSQTELATARAELESGVAQSALAKGDVTAKVASLTALTMVAPAGGLLQNVSVAAGQVVAAGAQLAEVVSLARLWIRVPIYAGDRRQFQHGATVSVQRLGGERGRGLANARPIAGPQTADPGSASIDLYYELDASPAAASAASEFRPGERVSVGLRLASGSSRGMAVPFSAIVYDMNGGSWIYEQADSLKFVRRRVEVARVVDGKAVIARGISPGMRVVTVGVVELFGSEFGIGK